MNSALTSQMRQTGKETLIQRFILINKEISNSHGLYKMGEMKFSQLCN
jgi:hypothetical protein